MSAITVREKIIDAFGRGWAIAETEAAKQPSPIPPPALAEVPSKQDVIEWLTKCREAIAEWHDKINKRPKRSKLVIPLVLPRKGPKREEEKIKIELQEEWAKVLKKASTSDGGGSGGGFFGESGGNSSSGNMRGGKDIIDQERAWWKIDKQEKKI